MLGTFWEHGKPHAGNLQLNRSDAQGRKMIAGWMLSEGGGVRLDEVTQRYPATLQLTTIGWGGGHTGQGGLRADNTASITPGVAISIPAMTRYAIECRLQRTTGVDAYACVCTEGGGRGLFFKGTVGGSNLSFFDAGADHLSTETIDFGRSVHVVATTRGSGTLDLYIDGQLDSVHSFAVPTFTPNSLLNDSASQTFIGVLEYMRILEELNADDVHELYTDPYRMFCHDPDLLELIVTGGMMVDMNRYFFFFR